MLLQRVLTAIVLLALVCAILFGTEGESFKLAALILPLSAAWEWGGLFGYSRPQRGLYLLLSAGLGALAWWTPTYHPAWAPILALGAVFWLLVAPAWLFLRWKMGKATAAVVGWLLLFSAWQGLVVWREKGALALIALMAVVWIADTAAYFTGKAFGRRKLAPAISPGKTWEGAAGAFVAVTVYLVAVIAYSQTWAALGPAQWLFLALSAALLTAISIVGDLLESLFKRQAGVKDSGKLLPGHGGVLDRVDSLLALLAFAGTLRWLLQQGGH